MALTVTHDTTVQATDDSSYEVGSDEWNANHQVTGTLASTDITGTFSSTSIVLDGTDTHVLFNDSDVIGGDAGLTYNKTTNVLTNTGGQLVLSGGTVTASAPILDGSQTWNSAGTTFSGFKVNITATARADASRPLQFQMGGVDNIYTNPDGSLFIRQTAADITGFICTFLDHSGNTKAQVQTTTGTFIVTNAAGGTMLGSNNARSQINFGGSSVFLGDEGTGILGQRVSTTPNTFRVYNTHDGATGAPTDYERGVFDWTTTANVLTIGSQAGGTGTYREVRYDGAKHQFRILNSDHIVFQDVGAAIDNGMKFNNNNFSVAWSDVAITRNGTTEIGVNATYHGGDGGWACGYVRTPIQATKTIATGVITITGGLHLVDTEAAGASDDLDTINGGQSGQLLVIRAANSARTVVAKDGTGNLKLAGDFSMDNTEDTLIMISDGTNWYELSRSDNGA